MKAFLLDAVHATEDAAIAAYSYIGSGNGLEADGAATTALRDRLNKAYFCGIVKIGEGKKDKAPGLFEGEQVGQLGMEVCDRYDIAVDPIDGTKLTISGRPGAISTMALAHENGFYTTKAHYSLKLACGRRLADHLHLLDPIEETVRIARNKLGKNITVCVLDRPRHRGLILKL